MLKRIIRFNMNYFFTSKFQPSKYIVFFSRQKMVNATFKPCQMN